MKELDISKEKNGILRALKLKISFLENFILYSLFLPFIIFYSELIFIKSVRSLNNKLKPLNINLYEKLSYLIDYITLYYTLQLSSIFLPFYLGMCTSPCLAVIIYILNPYLPLLLKFLTSNEDNYLFFQYIVLPIILIIFIIIIIYGIIFHFRIIPKLKDKYLSNLSIMCYYLYELTNIEIFKECEKEILNLDIKIIFILTAKHRYQKHKTSKIDLSNLDKAYQDLKKLKDIYKKLYQGFQSLQNKITITKILNNNK